MHKIFNFNPKVREKIYKIRDTYEYSLLIILIYCVLPITTGYSLL